VGSVTVEKGNVRVVDVIHAAEELAVQDAQRASAVRAQAEIATIPGGLSPAA
jgi:hypothetical protein